MKEFLKESIWGVFTLAVVVTTFLLLVLVAFIMNKFDVSLGFGWVIFITLLTTIIVLIISIIKGWTQVPEKFEYMVEFMGDYIGNPIEAGPKILFPWFKFVRIKVAQFRGTQLMELFLDEREREGRGGGDVEFKDCSSSIKSFFYYRIFDSALATYEVDDVVRAIEELTDHMLRSFFGPYSIDQAIELKSKFGLREVACLVDFNKDPNKKVTDEEFEESHFYQKLKVWGVEPRDLAISDIQLPPSVKEQREKVLKAKQEAQAALDLLEKAKTDAKKEIETAEGKKRATELIGEGEANALKSVMDASGLTKELAAQYLVAQKKWDTIKVMKDNPKFTLIEGGGGAVNLGAAIGSGIDSAKTKEA